MRGRPAEWFRGAPFCAGCRRMPRQSVASVGAPPLVAQLPGAREAHFRSENTSVYVRVSS